MRTVYLDNNATTPVAPEVFAAMQPFHTEYYGNPSSAHRQGVKPAVALREARGTIASFLGCDPGELVFTSCGTESDNIAILGVLHGIERAHVVTTAVEHDAVLKPLLRLGELGHEVTVLEVDSEGRVDLDALRTSIRDDAALIAAMYANNETGVIFPIRDIAAIANERGVPVLVDAVQAVGKIPCDVSALGVDMLSISAHKFHGPKGVGALFVRKGTKCDPVLLGGGQERGRRPGTENVAGIVAMAKACELARDHLDHYGTEVRRLRDRLEQGILAGVPDVVVHGGASERLPNTSSVRFAGIEGQAMIMLLDEVGICAASGPACHSGAGTPSHVLSAMGISPEDGAGTLRFSLSRLTTEEEIDYALDRIPGIVQRMRERQTA